MKLFPAIEVKNGRCVKLRQGHFHDAAFYAHTPSKIAQNFEQMGVSCIHIIDLDGAVAGYTVNAEIIKQIVDSISIPVQVGGGIRTIKDIENMFELGVDRVVIGAAAATNPAFVKEAIGIFGADKIVVSIDAKKGEVAIEGWDKIGTYQSTSLAVKMKDMGIQTIIYTDILRNRELSGSRIQNIKEIIATSNLDVIVSGGISSLKDIEVINSIGVKGAIIGRAIYENRVDLRNAIELFEKGETD